MKIQLYIIVRYGKVIYLGYTSNIKLKMREYYNEFGMDVDYVIICESYEWSIIKREYLRCINEYDLSNDQHQDGSKYKVEVFVKDTFINKQIKFNSVSSVLDKFRITKSKFYHHVDKKHLLNDRFKVSYNMFNDCEVLNMNNLHDIYKLL